EAATATEAEPTKEPEPRAEDEAEGADTAEPVADAEPGPGAKDEGPHPVRQRPPGPLVWRVPVPPPRAPDGREAARHQKAIRDEERRRADRRRRIRRLISRDKARKARRRRMLVAIVLAPLVVAAGLAAVAYYVDTIPAPADLTLPESTTIYYADGTTPMATLGSENRTILS